MNTTPSPDATSATHTAEPWTVGSTRSGGTFASLAVIGGDGQPVCIITRNVGDLTKPYGGESGANARLMAASPKLLAALNKTMARLEYVTRHSDFTNEVEDALNEARAAIAAAGGANAPVKTDPPSVMIVMDGGIVQNVVADIPIHVVLVDHDVEGATEDELTKLPRKDGGPDDDVYIGLPAAEVDSAEIDRVMAAFSAEISRVMAAFKASEAQPKT